MVKQNFVGIRGDEEIDLDKLQQILSYLETKKKGLLFVFDQRTETTKTNLEFGTSRARWDKVGKERDEVDQNVMVRQCAHSRFIWPKALSGGFAQFLVEAVEKATLF